MALKPKGFQGVFGFSDRFFAIGRATFRGPLVDYRAQKIPRETAVARIAASYREWVDLLERAK
jgi:hypothetical protein